MALTLLGCSHASSAGPRVRWANVARSVQSNDFVALRNEFAPVHSRGLVTNDAAARAARLVIEHELRPPALSRRAPAGSTMAPNPGAGADIARGKSHDADVDGISDGNDEALRVRELGLCALGFSGRASDAGSDDFGDPTFAADLEDWLIARAGVHDAAGAEAAWALVDSGRVRPTDARVRAFVTATGTGTAAKPNSDNRWRAVTARALSQRDDGDRRRAALLDPSPRVRKGAIRAAAEARDKADWPALYDVLRSDPEPMLRNEAVRAMNALARRADVLVVRTYVQRLRDAWVTGDDAIRQEIAVAWGMPPMVENGGGEALFAVINREPGPGAIAAAASALSAVPLSGSASKVAALDGVERASLVSAAHALLARTLRTGTTRDRVHAAFVAPFEGEVLQSLRYASFSDDESVRVASLARLLGSKPDHDASLAALRQVAGNVFGSETIAFEQMGMVHNASKWLRALDALRALARANDLSVQAWVERLLASPRASDRVEAVTLLAALGRPARGVLVLADSDPSVRSRAACLLAGASRR